MKSIYSYLFIFSIALPFSLQAQQGNQTIENRRDFTNFTFENLSPSLFPTGILLDKNAEIGTNWEKFKLNATGELDQPVDVNQWFELHNFIFKGQVVDGNMVNPDDKNWPLFNKLSGQIDQGEVTLPLFIIDYYVNRFTDQALAAGNFTLNNGQFFEGNAPQQGVEQQRLFYTGFLASSSKNKNISLELNDDYILSNRQGIIDHVEITINGTQLTLNYGQPVNLEPYIVAGENQIEIELFRVGISLGDGKTIFLFDFIEVQLPETEEDFFDEVGTYQNTPTLTYGIKYACHQNKIRKPVFFVAGFGLATPMKILNDLLPIDCKTLYDKYNLDNLMEELSYSGHDIIVVRFTPAVADVQSGAQSLVKLIKEINQRKYDNGSNFENIIIGYSSGAISVRYALQFMEYEHMEYGNPHPHSKLYVSFEGEHQGASIPVGIQVLLNDMQEEYPSFPVNVFHYMANSEQARQLLKHYWTRNGKWINGVPSSPLGQGPHGDRALFMQELENNLITEKQEEKHGTDKYHFPAFSRNVSIVNGSRKTHAYNSLGHVVNYPYNFNYGHQIFKQTDPSITRQVNLYKNNTVASGLANVYSRNESSWGGSYSEYYRTSGIQMWDNAPGGFLGGQDGIVKFVMDIAYLKDVGAFTPPGFPGDPDVGGGKEQFKHTSFTPTISCLDIQNFTTSTTEIHYDLWENDLQRVNFGSTIQGDYGYPSLGHPRDFSNSTDDHFDITPFEGIYADAFNDTHISSLRLSTGTPTDDEDAHAEINNFIFNEIQYKTLRLQNQQVGWNTDGSEYKAEYETQNKILIGESISPRTDVAPYEILSNGNIECRAKNTIEIKEGFHAQFGSEFHAHIHTPPCIFLSGGPSGMALNNNSEHQWSWKQEEWVKSMSPKNEKEEEDSPSFEGSLKIFPNPNNGAFTIKFGEQFENGQLEIFDMTGRLRHQQAISSGETIQTYLPTGIYMVKLKRLQDVFRQKIIVE